ncbi:MAG: DUF4249 family protein [Bacteroidales bacterium]|nr:DUF4249 family protein [Bacteroidales bacterium]
MRKHLIITILIAVLGCVACENTIKYEYDLSDGKMTILGQLSTADSKHTLFLSMSYPDRIDSLPGATVECFVNGSRSLANAVPAGYTEEIVDWWTGETELVPNHFPYTRYEFEANFKPGDKVRIEATKGSVKAWSETYPSTRGDSLRGHGDCRQDFSVSKRRRDRDLRAGICRIHRQAG